MKILKIITDAIKREVFVKDDDGAVISLNYGLDVSDAKIFAEIEGEGKKAEMKKEKK